MKAPFRLSLPGGCAGERRSQQNGFGLIEMLITLVVISSGLLAIASMYTNIISSSVVSKQRSEAVALGEKKLEELRGLAYSSLVTASDTVTAVASSGSSADYQRSWTVTQVSSPAYSNIALTVSWTDSKGQAQSVTLTSRISSVTTTPITIP